LEKALLLYGHGANGKSVCFDIVNALLGPENVCSYSLQHLTDVDRGGQYRAKIANKLVNYASEISGKLEASIFKTMVSGEPIEARPLYEQPFLIANYAKLIFNVNELPKEVEHTHAFFRRLLVIPFNVTIPANEQDESLSKKIIKKELSGIFNWVLEGLTRLLTQRGFTESEIVNEAVQEYKKESDNVLMFIEDKNYKSSDTAQVRLQDLYQEYRRYCNECCHRACSDRTFSTRLRNSGFEVKRKNSGMVVWIEKEESEGSVEGVGTNKFFLNGLSVNHQKFLNLKSN
jgi:putative DNA primase/helicase